MKTTMDEIDERVATAELSMMNSLNTETFHFSADLYRAVMMEKVSAVVKTLYGRRLGKERDHIVALVANGLPTGKRDEFIERAHCCPVREVYRGR